MRTLIITVRILPFCILYGFVFYVQTPACSERPIGTGNDAATPRCGDGIIHQERGEQCDGDDMGGATCAGLGFDSGALACSSDCQLDTAGCVPLSTCGDGVAQSDEDCDGEDFKEATCFAMGWDGGGLLCTTDCRYDTDHCCDDGWCFDGFINCGEECEYDSVNDTWLFRGATCEDFGYDGGDLNCDSCAIYSSYFCCYDGPCGNEELNCGEACETFAGETWFNTDETCESLGFDGGTLGCSECDLDTSGCY